jgi:SAM-dependent methyltransferase
LEHTGQTVTEPQRPPTCTDFSHLAARYDELRPADEHWWQAVEQLVRLGDLRGRRVLDVGCGTGRLLAALVERYACKAWGVDPSPEMLAVARERLPRAVALRRASAEQLPFRDGWFERATMTLVVHHTDLARALPEVRRVLAACGRLAVLTFDARQFESYHLNRFFPSLADADRARFPTGEALEEALRRAGFAEVRRERLTQERVAERADVLRQIEGRHISTFQLIPADEYAAGLERARRELPEQVEYANELLLVAAARA